MNITARPPDTSLGAFDVRAFPSFRTRDVWIHGYPRDGSLGANDVQGRPANMLVLIVDEIEPPPSGYVHLLFGRLAAIMRGRL